MTDQINYCSGYKYQLRNNYACATAIRPAREIATELVRLHMDGRLWIAKYFAWDGASGPTIDDRTNMRASLVHDALYYLMRIGLLEAGWRLAADHELYKAMIADGAGRIRATYYEWAVNTFAAKCAAAGTDRPILVAP